MDINKTRNIRAYIALKNNNVKYYNSYYSVIMISLSGANLFRADLSSSNLSMADLSRADLSSSNLSMADLSDANLSRANLSRADLSEANLSRADLFRANLSGANLFRADLSGANLFRADLSGANLFEANLSGAKNLLDQKDWMAENFKKTKNGYIVYKAFGDTYYINNWDIKENEYITEVSNTLRTNLCGCGINFATKEWIEKEFRDEKTELWECLIKWEDMINVTVPYNTDGKARCERLKLLRRIK